MEKENNSPDQLDMFEGPTETEEFDRIELELDAVAAEMFMIYMNHSDDVEEGEERKVSDDGLRLLTEYFDGILPFYRVDVFARFINRLIDAGIKFSVRQLQTGSVH